MADSSAAFRSDGRRGDLRIADVFRRARERNRAALMPYLVAGDPDLPTSKRLVRAFAAAGADLLELGVPFSDPMADGPTNQAACQRALRSGTTLPKILEAIRDLRQDLDLPILLMGYYNPFFAYGLERFFHDAREAGVDGVILPDLPPDDASEIRSYADATGIATVFLVAPTSTPQRLHRVATESRGFVYAVSLTGVTGERDRLPEDLEDFLRRLRRTISLPIAVGFGIGTPAMVKTVARLADGVIVGSAIVRRIGEAVEGGRDPVPEIEDFVAKLVQATALI